MISSHYLKEYDEDTFQEHKKKCIEALKKIRDKGGALWQNVQLIGDIIEDDISSEDRVHVDLKKNTATIYAHDYMKYNFNFLHDPNIKYYKNARSWRQALELFNGDECEANPDGQEPVVFNLLSRIEAMSLEEDPIYTLYFDRYELRTFGNIQHSEEKIKGTKTQLLDIDANLLWAKLKVEVPVSKKGLKNKDLSQALYSYYFWVKCNMFTDLCISINGQDQEYLF